jgi:plasmid stability protein
MALLQIRNLPDELYQALVRKAAEERRSLSQQAIVVLSKGLEADSDPKARLRRALAQAKRLNAGRGKSLSDPVKLIREDRDR